MFARFALITALILLAACSARGESATDGPTIYANQCASCHGGDLGGGIGPALAPLDPTLTDEDIASIITNGKGTMPAYGFLDDQQVAAVIDFLRREG